MLAMTKSKTNLNGSAALMTKAVQGLFEESRDIFEKSLKETENTLLNAISTDIDKGLEKVKNELKRDLSADIATQMKEHQNVTQKQINAAFDKAEKRRGARPRA